VNCWEAVIGHGWRIITRWKGPGETRPPIFARGSGKRLRFVGRIRAFLKALILIADE
jgi:hypothetical protein